MSHLDLMATVRRGLLRAGMDLRYSEGYNPHPYMSIALPLPVGVGSVCELMDIGMSSNYSPPGNLSEQLTAVMPEGIEILDVYSPDRKFADIAWIEISGRLLYDSPISNASEKLAERFSEESIIIAKKTKRGVSDVDIAPFFCDISFQGNGEISANAKISAQNPSINPGNLMSALCGEYAELAPDFSEFTRVEFYDAEMTVFK